MFKKEFVSPRVYKEHNAFGAFIHDRVAIKWKVKIWAKVEYPNAYLKDIKSRKTRCTLLIKFKVARGYIQ